MVDVVDVRDHAQAGTRRARAQCGLDAARGIWLTDDQHTALYTDEFRRGIDHPGVHAAEERDQ